MNTEDGAKLYDVCPHVSDSVRSRGVLLIISRLHSRASVPLPAARTLQQDLAGDTE